MLSCNNLTLKHITLLCLLTSYLLKKHICSCLLICTPPPKKNVYIYAPKTMIVLTYLPPPHKLYLIHFRINSISNRDNCPKLPCRAFSLPWEPFLHARQSGTALKKLYACSPPFWRIRDFRFTNKDAFLFVFVSVSVRFEFNNSENNCEIF